MHDEPGRPDNEQGAEDAGREPRTDGIADEQGGGERREAAGEAVGERSDAAAETGEAGAGPEAGTGAPSGGGSDGGRWGGDEQGYQRSEAAPPPRRLTRSQHDRILGGVAAGIAEYFNVDPLLVRLAFVLVTLFGGGVGALGYLIAWAAIPASPGLPDEPSGRRRILQIWLLVAGVLLLVAPLGTFPAATGFHPFRPSALLGLALIVAGVLLFRDDARRQRTGDGLPPPPAPHGPGSTPGYPAAPSGYGPSATTAPTPGLGYAPSVTQPVSSERERGFATAAKPAAPPTSGAAAGGAPAGDAPAGGAPAGGAAAGAEMEPGTSPAARFARPDRPGSDPSGSGRGSVAGAGGAPATREGSILGRTVVGVVLIVLGLAAVVDMLDIVELRLTAYLALALLVVGAGLLVGAWRGRSRGLIILGLALVPPLLVASVLPFPLEGGFGERVVHVNSLSGVDDAYRLAAGRLLLDVSEVRFPAGETELEASVGAGEIEVVVPPDVTVIVDAQLRAGEVNFFGEHIDVTPADRVRSGGWSGERRRMEDGEGGWTPFFDEAPFRRRGRPGSGWHGAGNQLMIVDEGREGAGTLRLRLRAGMGELIVRRGPAL